MHRFSTNKTNTQSMEPSENLYIFHKADSNTIRFMWFSLYFNYNRTHKTTQLKLICNSIE